jgi:hypothetical protein
MSLLSGLDMTIPPFISTSVKPDKATTIGGILLKKLLISLLVFALVIGTALAASNIDSAYQLASKEAGETTTAVVESIDLSEFEEHFGLSLSAEDEKLVRIALLAYSNGAILVHPAGINRTAQATTIDDPYVGNKNSKKFHYSWCSSVSDIKENNKVTFSSREEATSQGYEPCKRCEP